MSKRINIFGPKPPETPIEFLIRDMKEYLHLPDPSALQILMGAVAANFIEGEPCWVMLIGPPGCGKSELLNSLLDIPRMQDHASISGEAAFLSGTSKKDVVSGATGGILRKVGAGGGVVLNDFTSMLSMGRDELRKILAVFRECYSGKYTRTIGIDGGRELHWRGKLALFAGVTGVIDQHHTLSSSLGERWVYCRFGEDNGSWERARRAMENSDRTGWRLELRKRIALFFEELGLGFEMPSRMSRELEDKERWKILQFAELAVRCRSGVLRDSRTHEILGIREREESARMTAVLKQLYYGLDVIGVSDETRWELIQKVALDSMPQVRRVVVDGAMNKPAAVQEIVKSCGASRTVIDRAIEELEVHGVVVKEIWDKKAYVYLTEWAAEQAGKHYYVRNPQSVN